MVNVQLADQIEAALGRVVGLVVKVQQDRPAARLELTTHEQRVVLARFGRVVGLFRDLAERRTSAPNLLLPSRCRLDRRMVPDVDEACVAVDLRWGVCWGVWFAIL